MILKNVWFRLYLSHIKEYTQRVMVLSLQQNRVVLFIESRTDFSLDNVDIHYPLIFLHVHGLF